MKNLNRRFVLTLGIGWFALAGFGLSWHWVARKPPITVIIDRSYCSPQNWTQVSQKYVALYQQHRQRQQIIAQVILVHDLGIEVLPNVPTAETIQNLATYGRPNPSLRTQVQSQYPQSQLLFCP